MDAAKPRFLRLWAIHTLFAITVYAMAPREDPEIFGYNNVRSQREPVPSILGKIQSTNQ
jgi:hypothetical protein